MNTLVIGAAVSGAAAARLARRLGHDVAVYDANDTAVAALRIDGFAAHSGAWSPRMLDGIDLVVTSPGVPPGAPPIADTLGSGTRLWSEMEFAARHLDAPYVAVTGTNGKTTVVEATTAMLERSGMKACAAGNIGTALSDVVGEPWDVVVIEASSFQLHFIEAFHPVAATLLNVAPDHLDWHGSEAEYASAKARIYDNQTPADILVYDVDDAGAVAAVDGATATLIPVSGQRRPEGGNGVEGDGLGVDGMRLPLPELGASFRVDLVAAATMAHHVGAGAAGIASAITAFQPGAHRRTVVGTWEGATWVDDSKATNPHAAVAAAEAYADVVLIAGGRNKDLDLTPITEVASVRHIVALGEAAAEIAAAAPDRVTVVATMEDAVTVADGLAMPGSTVLLAPGCASFDMYHSYGERGDRFSALVVDLKGGNHGQ